MSVASPRDDAVGVRVGDREAPGLKLTAAQASRFWSLGPDASRALLDSLVDARVLRRTDDGHYGSRS